MFSNNLLMAATAAMPPSLAEINYVGQHAQGAHAGTDHTFSDADMGPVVANKKVVVVATCQSLTGVTVGGNAMTQAAFVTGIVPSMTVGIYEYNAVLTDTEDITLTSTTGGNWIAHVFYLTNATAAAEYTGTDRSNSGAVLDADVTCSVNSVAIGGWLEQITGTEIPTVWTGLTGPVAEIQTSGAFGGGVASGSFESAQSPLNVTCTFQYAASPAYCSLVLASWGTA
jgi:hypothetical protein